MTRFDKTKSGHVPENPSRTVRFIVKVYAGDRISLSPESAAEQEAAS